ncbi:MAG: 4Fe-4S binding protein, partial [candidate division WOR-3 bacterium]
HLSHKRIGVAAGLGWIGRNNLLVHPQYGSQFRLVTILTDMPLATDTPLNSDCQDCRKCIEVCPAQAIKERPEDFDHMKCFEQLKEFQKKGYVGQYICGVCVKACSGLIK